MTEHEVRAWLEARRPAPPPVLARQLAAALAACPAARLAEAGSVAAVMCVLATACLASLDDRPPAGVEVAMDLLAADAFITYAFEAAAEEGAPAAPLAGDVLRRVTA